uniref:Uncharacterized protein n=1 Tax=Opuntia streptacantha TaxID=393608 RepID=A0A7C9AU00_OPUST
MDLNEVPSDQIVNTQEFGEKIFAKSDGKFEGNSEVSRSKCSGVAEQKCREVEEECLALELEIRKKIMGLDAIRVRIRALEGEKAAIEQDLEGLKKKKKAAVEKCGVDELSMDDWNMGSAEESKVEELMIENKVLECEKMSALREVDVWKHKCKELESRVNELEERLSSQGRDGMLNGANSNSPSHCRGPNARDGEVQMAGTPCIQAPENQDLHIEDSQTGRVHHRIHVKRQLVFSNERRSDRKIAPSTPEGAINIIDSDDEHHSPCKHGCSFHSGGTPRSVHADETVGVMDLEDTMNCKDNILFVATPNRKRGPKVVFSDDECGDDEGTLTKRACKIDNGQNESGEDDDSVPMRQACGWVNGNSQRDGDQDDDDIPISQLKLGHAQCSSQPIARRTRSHSGHKPGAFTQSKTPPRRRLVKFQQGEETSGIVKETENSPQIMTTENVEDSDPIEDGSDSESDSLKSFIDDDSDIEDVEDDVAEEGADHSTEPEDSSDSNLDFREIISRLQRRKSPSSKWALEGEMLSDFGKDPELCMRAVCALYRQQTVDEKLSKESIFQNGRGFSKFDAASGK